METRTSFLIICCVAATAVVGVRADGVEHENTTTPPKNQQTHPTAGQDLSMYARRDGFLLDHLARLPQEQNEARWREFAWEAGLSDTDLAIFRAAVPQAGVADLAWIREFQSANTLWLDALWPLDAHDLLLSMPEMQLSFKKWADFQYGTPILRLSDPPALEAELWRRFASEIGSFADIDGPPFTAADALWVYAAQDYDAATLLENSWTADQLLTMPNYQLQRKLTVDSHVSLIVDCARCALDPTPMCDQRCQDYYLFLVRNCERFAEACEEAGGRFFGAECRRSLRRCLCSADCGRCLCAGGQLGSNEYCSVQCQSGSHDCTVINPLGQP